MHREGYRLEDVQLMVAAAGLASGNKLLAPLEQEVLLSWVAVVFLALQEAGVPRDLQVGAATVPPSSLSLISISLPHMLMTDVIIFVVMSSTTTYTWRP